MLRSMTITALILAGLFATGPAAGLSEPLLIRSVVLAGASGPAYYSVIEQGYRFLGGPGNAGKAVATVDHATAGRGRSNGEIALSSLDDAKSGMPESGGSVENAR